MNSTRYAVRQYFAVIVAIFALSFAAAAKSKENSAFPNVKIKNFGQMDERFFRGAEPKGIEDIRALKELGINTVIDLQEKPEPTERGEVESLGMRYVNIAIVDKEDPTEAQVAEFLKLASDPATGKFYVHCAGGRHRTGVMGAVYRFNFYGWDYDQVYAEMKQFDFYSSWGHGGQKRYVQDYWQRVQSGQIQVAPAATAAAAATAGANR